MTVCAVLFVPMMVWLAAWAYDVMKGPVRKEDIDKKSHELY